MSWSLFADRSRKRLLRQAPPGPVHDYLTAAWPKATDETRDGHLLALDLETSGLDPKSDDIVSIGWTLVSRQRIVLSSAKSALVQPRAPLPGSSVVIHGIGDDLAAGGRQLREVLSELLMDLRGRVLLGHHVELDARFLSVACQRLGWGAVRFPCICTLSLAERLARQRQIPAQAGSLTLASLRASYDLPEYPEHDALWDSIAAAELWLALEAEMAGRSGSVRLGRVLRTRP